MILSGHSLGVNVAHGVAGHLELELGLKTRTSRVPS